jgi:hypothetical protein
MNPVKHSLPINVITSLIAKIANETNHDTGRNVVSSATKKAVGPQNIPRKNEKIQRDDLRNVSSGILTELSGNTSPNTKELTTTMMKMVKKTKWTRMR